MGQNSNKKIASKPLTLKWNLFFRSSLGRWIRDGDVYPTVTKM
jgi:hypothetical protein